MASTLLAAAEALAEDMESMLITAPLSILTLGAEDESPSVDGEAGVQAESAQAKAQATKIREGIIGPEF